ncbi:MAG: S8 family serine peptidase, partial [Dehalococcoidia bacterium]
DTGVMTNAPDYSARLLPALSTTGAAPFSDATLGASATLRHGTWVASVAAMGVNNAIGGAGVGNFSILPITITNSNGNNSSSWIADAIRAAADAGCKVINISHSTLTYGGLDAAAAEAKAKGALVFMAAGNTGARINRTGFDNLIFVSGTDRDDALWSGSSWGPYVDLAAPAMDIFVADPTLTPSGYGYPAAGTSFASPLAAGVAGLLWSINPNLTPDQVRDILYSTALDLGTPGFDEQFGNGRVNAAAAAAAALATVPEPATWLLAAVGLAGVVGLTRRRRASILRRG